MLYFKDNFKGNHLNDMLCPCCFTEPDTQLHLIFCTKLSGSVSEEEFLCIFGANDEKMEKVVKKLEKKLQERKSMLE